MNHEEKQKSFLEELQSLNEPTKRRILIISTIVIMVVVIYLWLGYFNGLVAGGQTQSAAATPEITSGSEYNSGGDGSGTSGSSGGTSFARNFKTGLAVIGSDFTGAMQSLFHMFSNPGQYNIHPGQ